jgi:hypothetical protein
MQPTLQPQAIQPRLCNKKKLKGMYIDMYNSQIYEKKKKTSDVLHITYFFQSPFNDPDLHLQILYQLRT